MSENVLLDKSKAFALRIIKMYKYLTEEKQTIAILIAQTSISKLILKMNLEEKGQVKRIDLFP